MCTSTILAVSRPELAGEERSEVVAGHSCSEENSRGNTVVMATAARGHG